jgi:hypothetical protein
MRKITIAISLFALIFSIACSKRVLVQIPPRVDLHSFQTIGMIEFGSNTEGTLSSFASQRFLQALQQAQPGVQVLELGSEADLMESIGHEKLDHAALKTIGEQYGVEAVMVGDVEVSDVRPNVDVYNVLTTMSVSAEVDASLTTRLFETARGATLWTSSTRGTRTVAHAGIGHGGPIRFDAEDPEKAYGELVDALIVDATRDFRVTYARH